MLGFQTDTAISGQSGSIKERKLQKWTPTEQEQALGLELDNAHQLGAWDQFAANEKLFGVETDFDEHIYTTAVDKSGADFKAREQEAIRLAREIEKGPVSSQHIAEERGLKVNDDNDDEETKYSSVIRPSGERYIPPAARKAAADAAKSVLSSSPKESFADKLKNRSNAQRAPETKPVEEAAKSFKNFADSEKKLIMQQKEALMKSHKDGVISQLKKFSDNFKLPTPMPKDLKEILNKKSAEEEPLKETKPVKDAWKENAKPSKSEASKEAPKPSTTEAPNEPSKSSKPDSSKEPAKSFKAETSKDKVVEAKPQAWKEPGKLAELKPEGKPSETKPQAWKEPAKASEPSIQGRKDIAKPEEGKPNGAPSSPERAKTDATPTKKSAFSFNAAASEFTPTTFGSPTDVGAKKVKGKTFRPQVEEYDPNMAYGYPAYGFQPVGRPPYPPVPYSTVPPGTTLPGGAFVPPQVIYLI